MNKYWSELTKALNPYVPGEQPQDQTYIKLNTNENPFPPSELVISRIKERVSESLRLYPDPDASKLKVAIANYHHVDENCVFVGNGSDEVLAFSFLAFFKNKSALSFPNISYSFYPVYCSIFEIPFNTFALNSQLEIDIRQVPAEAGGIIFPNPNAPTGIFLSTIVIEDLLQKFPNIVVVIDEAYIDFGGDSCIPLTEKYDNLLVVQTFSKSRSLAGLRVGFAIGNANLIEGLNRVKNSFNSYPLDTLAIEGAVAAIQDNDYFSACCHNIIETREWVKNELTAMSFVVLPTKANFLFVTHAKYDAKNLYRKLKEKGILVRHFNNPDICDFLRISVGKKEDMVLLVDSIKSIIEIH